MLRFEYFQWLSNNRSIVFGMVFETKGLFAVLENPDRIIKSWELKVEFLKDTDF